MAAKGKGITLTRVPKHTTIAAALRTQERNVPPVIRFKLLKEGAGAIWELLKRAQFPEGHRSEDVTIDRIGRVESPCGSSNASFKHA